MASCRWLGKFHHTRTRAMHSRRYACDSLNNNHFRNQQHCLWWVLRDVVGPTSTQKLAHSRAPGGGCAGGPKCLPPRGSVCAGAAPEHLHLSTSRPNIPSDSMSSAVIVTSIGVPPRVLLPSTARATLRDDNWLMQWPLEGLLAFRPGRGSACSLSFPHLFRFYANVVDLLLSAGSTAWTASVSQTGRRSHLTDRVLAFG